MTQGRFGLELSQLVCTHQSAHFLSPSKRKKITLTTQIHRPVRRLASDERRKLNVAGIQRGVCAAEGQHALVGNGG